MKPLIFWSILAMLLMIGCPWLAATFAGSASMAMGLPTIFERPITTHCLPLGSIPYFLLYAAYLQERTSSGCGPFQLLSRDYFWQGRGYSLRWVKQRFCCIASAIS